MNIIKITPRGYCKGVVNAINIAKQTAIKNPNKSIYVLGNIVHNTYVSKALKQYNIKTIEDKNKTKLELLDQINDGIVIFTAHGISNKVIQKALDKGLEVVDASCTDVRNTKAKVIEKINEGFNVLYIGKKNHPEAEAVIQDFDKVTLITSIDDLNDIHINNDKIYVTNQTTMSIIEIADIFKLIKAKYPNAIIEEEICNATRLRQEAIIKTNDLDLLYVVGDPSSNNSNKLKDIALNHGIKKVQLIENCHGINEDDLNVTNIGVTAGASTPTYLTNQVIQALETYAIKHKLELPEIEIDKIL